MKIKQESKYFSRNTWDLGSHDSMVSIKRYALGKIEARKIISLGVLLLLFLWMIHYVRTHISEFNPVFGLSLSVLAIISILLLLDSVILGLFNKVLMQNFNISLRFKEWYGLSVASNLWNYILPFQGGASVRAIYLKKVHNFVISNFFGTMFALYFVSFLVSSFLGLTCILYMYIRYHYLNMIVFSFFAVVFSGVSIFMVFSVRVPKFKNQFLRKISEIVNAWHSIQTNMRLVINLVLIILLHIMIELVTVYFAFYAYGVGLSFYKCLLISVFLEFSVLIKITPGSLGITEAIVIFSAKIFGITPAQSLLAAGLIRVVNMGWIFTLGPIYNYVLSLKMHSEHD